MNSETWTTGGNVATIINWVLVVGVAVYIYLSDRQAVKSKKEKNK